MKALLGAGLVLTAVAFSETPADRTSIEQVIRSLLSAKTPSVLFTADADSDLDRLKDADLRMAEAARQPWSELTPPQLVIQAIRFMTPDVATVDVADTQFGTVPRRVPLLLVMKKNGSDWRIASLKVLTASTFF
jgi:hypothetical protein